MSLQDRFPVSYIGAARDVLSWDRVRSRLLGPPIVACAPAFGDGAACGVAFPPLSGAVVEGRAVAALLGVSASEGTAASRALLLSCRAPGVLHVATHGYYVPRSAQPMHGAALFEAAMIADPMLRSELALAGANVHADGSGLLTAAEVAGLDLRGTELVVLSACQTGLGDVETGEGISGLRRAFAVAGARRLVVSLWPVPDSSTMLLMRGFYEELVAGADAVVALTRAQQRVQAVFPHPVPWAGFVLQGEIGPIPDLASSAAPSPPADEAIDEGIASALDRIVDGLREAGVHFEAGRFDEAIAGAHIAIAAAEARTEPHALGPLVSALQLLACAHQRDRPREALAAIERAIAILEATIARPGGARNWTLLEAGVHQSAGTALRRLGQPLAGIGAQTRSQRVLERAVAEHPDWTPAWQTLASTYMNKANAVEELGQLRAAIGLYDLSLEVWDRLAAGGDPSMRARGAKVRVLRAATLRELGDEDTAVAEARAGLAVLEAQRDTLVHPDFANLISWAQEALSLAKPS